MSELPEYQRLDIQIMMESFKAELLQYFQGLKAGHDAGYKLGYELGKEQGKREAEAVGIQKIAAGIVEGILRLDDFDFAHKQKIVAMITSDRLAGYMNACLDDNPLDHRGQA